jgi:hypothetical protein
VRRNAEGPTSTCDSQRFVTATAPHRTYLRNLGPNRSFAAHSDGITGAARTAPSTSCRRISIDIHDLTYARPRKRVEQLRQGTNSGIAHSRGVDCPALRIQVGKVPSRFHTPICAGIDPRLPALPILQVAAMTLRSALTRRPDPWHIGGCARSVQDV